MATKRETPINNLVKKTMEGRNINPTKPENGKIDEENIKPPEKKQITLRLEPEDYTKLKKIAYRRGTNAAALIREAVKEIIRKD